MKDTKQLWSYLPVQYCNNDNITSSETNCWNGTVTSQEKRNTQTPAIVLEQIYTLEVWIGKLQSAYQGQEVDIVDDSEESLTEGSGSGSGDSIDTSKEEDNDDLNVFTEIVTTTIQTSSTSSERTLNHIPPHASNAPLPSLSRALFQYILPIVFVCFGGAISDLL